VSIIDIIHMNEQNKLKKKTYWAKRQYTLFGPMVVVGRSKLQERKRCVEGERVVMYIAFDSIELFSLIEEFEKCTTTGSGETKDDWDKLAKCDDNIGANLALTKLFAGTNNASKSADNIFQRWMT
jgi:hypothetical protein